MGLIEGVTHLQPSSQKTMKNIIIAILGTAIVVFAAVSLTSSNGGFVGSVERASEYNSTTSANGLWTSASENISSTTYATVGGSQTAQGTFGSIIITGAAAGVINIYDATTSDITRRSATQASTSILIGSIPASAAAGTYTFDVRYLRGLIVQIVGATPTTTITWRE